MMPTVPYSIAFWVDDGRSHAATLSLENSWAIETGIYVFLKAVLDGEQAIEPQPLSDRLREFQATPSLRNTRFLWLENPADPMFRWRFQALTLAPSAGASIVARQTYFDFRNYGLAIARSVTCRLSDTNDGFIFAADSAIHNVFGAESDVGKGDPFYVSTGYGARRLKGLVVNEAREAIALPLTGSLAGCFTFALTLQNRSPGSEPFEELTQMDIALRMFFKSANATLEANNPFSLIDPLLGFAIQNKEAEGFLVASHRYPFLGEDADAASHYSKQADDSQNLTLYAALDPLQPLNGDRTYFTFVEPGHSTISELSLPSCYRTNLGYSIHVTPHSYDESRLVFAERPGQNTSSFDAPLYLVSTGTYTLSVPDYTQTPIPSGNESLVQSKDNFLCGLAGIEYIQLSSQHDNILHLQPGQSAFAADFVPDQIVEMNQAEQRLESLDSQATTAWAYIEYLEQESDSELQPQLGADAEPLERKRVSPIYFSQPSQSLLYRASAFQDNDSDPTNDPLRFLEIPVTGLPDGGYLPLFPYGGVTGTLTHYQQLEEQLLNPQRRERIRVLAETDSTSLLQSTTQSAPTLETPGAPEISALNMSGGAEARPVEAALVPPEPSETTITGTTPRGLLATYSGDYETLNRLLLARDTDGKALSLQGLERRSPLRSAFQSSQMFLVISNPKSLQQLDESTPPTILKDYFSNNQLTIQGWTFDLNPQNWRQNRNDTDTVLIFKFLDKPLIDALKDTALWEQPGEFVGEVQTVKSVRDRLVRLFEEAIATANNPNASEKDRANAVPLARIAESSSWAGLIALNVALPSDQGLPKELRALECGIKDGENFYAQYVGSNGTPVLPKNGQLAAEQSSLFGLLDYQDNSVPETGSSGYAFQVSSLRVQFQNSQLTAFSSEVNLTLDRLFDEATLLLNSRSKRNIVVLKGFAEEHDGVVTYGFSFSGENYFALPDSYALNTVDIVKAEFSTDPPQENTTALTGRFTLWGRLNFRNLEQVDLLSFGLDTSLDRTVLTHSSVKDNLVQLVIKALEVLDRKDLIDNNPEAQAALATLKEFRPPQTDSQPFSVELTPAAKGAIATFKSLNPEALFPTGTTVDEVVQMAVRAIKARDLVETLENPEQNNQYLLFSKLAITMTCPLEKDAIPTFSFDPSQIAFDLKKSSVRPQSFYAKFPLKLVNFVYLNPDQPASKPKGYLPVKTPLGGGSLPTSGYGFNYELNLGSLGALAGAAQLVVNLLVVWEPNRDSSQKEPKMFVGLRLPGIGGDVLGFPLQSVLKLSFKSVELIVDRSNPVRVAYLLKIKKIALKFFVLSFPPSGQTEIVIFGNPDATDSNDAIGWYAAYAKEKPALPEGQSSGRASPTTPRR